MSPSKLHRLFDWLTLAETVTLVVLLVNLVTSHNEGVTSSVGPIHGMFYIGVIVVALLIPKLPNSIRAIAVIPAIGAPIAWWMMRHSANS